MTIKTKANENQSSRQQMLDKRFPQQELFDEFMMNQGLAKKSLDLQNDQHINNNSSKKIISSDNDEKVKSCGRIALFSFGKGIYGELGQGEDVSLSKYPQEVKGLPEGIGIVDVQCGSMHANVLLENGQIYTCGSEENNSNGKLYLNCNDEDAESSEYDDSCNYTFSNINIPAFITSIACGHCFNAALDDNGYVWLWGVFTNTHGEMFIKNRDQFATGGIMTRSYYDNIDRHKTKNNKSTINNHHYDDIHKNIKNKKNYDDLYQSESIIYTHDFSIVKIPERVVKIVAGSDHLVCLTQKHHVFSLGNGECGQLGRLSERSSKLVDGKRAYDRLLNAHAVSIQKRIIPLRGTKKYDTKSAKIVDIMATSTNSFFKDISGSLYGCGLNVFGQLGTNTQSENILMPLITFTTSLVNNDDNEDDEQCDDEIKIIKNNILDTTIDDIVAIKSGMMHSLILTQSGQVYTCGYCSDKLLGHNHHKYYMNHIEQFKDIKSSIMLSKNFAQNSPSKSTSNIFENECHKPRGCCVPFKVESELLKNTKIVQIACSLDCNFLLDDQGKCFAWGENSSDLIQTLESGNMDRPQELYLGPESKIKRINRIAVGNFAGFLLAECSL